MEGLAEPSSTWAFDPCNCPGDVLEVPRVVDGNHRDNLEKVLLALKCTTDVC